MTRALTLSLICCVSLPALAEELATGKLHPKVSGPGCSYAVYLPKAYTRARRWPVVFCFSPVGNGAGFARRVIPGAEQHGWVVVASNDSKNGPLLAKEIKAMVADSRQRLSLDPHRTYVSGMSGGSRVASWYAVTEGARGTISVGGVLSNAALRLGQAPPEGIAWYLCCGETCFNRKEMEQTHAMLQGAKRDATIKIFPGAHVMAPASVVTEAIAWHEGIWRQGAAKELTAALERLQAKAEAEPVACWREAEALLDRYRGVEGTAGLKALRSKLANTKPVKREITADKALARADAKAAKARSSFARKSAASGYRAVAKRYPGTRAAELATKRAAALEARPKSP